MKRIFVFLLALIMIFSFGACGEKEDPKPESQTVTVSFDCVGGSLISSMEIKKGSTIAQPADPTKDGYVFDCWYYNGSAFDFSKAINEDITLYATWKDAGNNGEQKPDDNKGEQKPDDKKEDPKPEENKEDKPTAVSVDSIKWNYNWYWVDKGISATPGITVVPESAKSSVTYSSSDEEIATVNKDGQIKGISGGKVTITATCGDKKAELSLEVRDAATSMKLNKSVIKLTYMSQNDYCDTLEAVFEPEWTSNKKVNMFIDNSEVAYFDAEGVIHALKPGKATITAKDAYGHTATCELYVNGAILTYTFNTNQYYSGSIEEYYIWLDEWKDGVETFTNVAPQCSMHGSAAQYLQANGTVISRNSVSLAKDTETIVWFTLTNGKYAGLQTDEVTFYIFGD